MTHPKLGMKTWRGSKVPIQADCVIKIVYPEKSSSKQEIQCSSYSKKQRAAPPAPLINFSDFSKPPTQERILK